MFKDNKALKKRKKDLKKRFEVELYPGAKLFYLSGMFASIYFMSLEIYILLKCKM